MQGDLVCFDNWKVLRSHAPNDYKIYLQNGQAIIKNTLLYKMVVIFQCKELEESCGTYNCGNLPNPAGLQSKVSKSIIK